MSVRTDLHEGNALNSDSLILRMFSHSDAIFSVFATKYCMVSNAATVANATNTGVTRIRAATSTASGCTDIAAFVIFHG